MAERGKLGRPSFSPTRKEAFRKDSNMSKKMFRDKKRQKRDEALSTVVPPTATRYKHIRVTTATFWRWRSLAQELGLDGDEQMASFLLNTYYERAVEAASQEQRQDIPQNSEESRQIVETSMFPDHEQGTKTDTMGSTTLPLQATQDGSIGLLLTEHPPDSMKEQVEDGWRGGDGDKTNDGGEMVLEGKFTCLIKTEPHESDEEPSGHEALPSNSQQGDGLTGDDGDRKEIEEVEFKCLIKEEPDDGEHNQPSCSQQGGDSRGQRSHHKESALIISGDPSVDTSHDGPRGEHLPEDFPIQTILGNLAGLSARGSYSGGDSRGQSSHHMESALKMSGDPSGDTSHDGPRGEHLPEDFPIQTVLGNLAGLSTRGSFSSEYGAHLLPNQGDYSQWQSPTMSDDHKEGRLDLKTDNARELDEKCESASSENKSSNVSSTSTNQTNLCINQQLFTCSVCQKGYNRKHNLYRHMRLHSGERPHECTYCKKRFWQSSELKRHLRIHTGQKPYSCSVCDKQFRDTSNLKVHMAVHLRKKKKYQCSFCDEGFSTRALRDTHSASAHPSEKPFHCMECDMRFCRRGSLQVHIWRTHTARDKPHVCSFCNKAFSHLCFLTTHKRIHTGEKPYECTVCGDRFSFHTQLADHKAKHTGVKPYSCSICEKRFWRKSCLNRHQRTHTGKKPFQCPECKKGFAEKGTLIKHLNTHPNL